MSPGGQTTATAYTIPFGSSTQVGVPMSAVSPLSAESQRDLPFQIGSTHVIAGNTYHTGNTYQTYVPSYDAFITDMQQKYAAPVQSVEVAAPLQQRTISMTSSQASGALLSPNRSVAPSNSYVVGSIVRDELSNQENLMEADLDLHREMARQETINFNMQHNVGAVKGATHITKQDGSRGIVFDLDGSLANGTTMDHVQRRRLMNATSGAAPEKPKNRAHHEATNINSVVRSLALNDKTVSRGTKMGTGIQPESSSNAITYELSMTKPKNTGAASGTYAGTGINAAVRNKAVAGSGALGFGDHNIIRDELKKEDNVLHPYRTLDEHRAYTRDETAHFQSRGWSPLR